MTHAIALIFGLLAAALPGSAAAQVICGAHQLALPDAVTGKTRCVSKADTRSRKLRKDQARKQSEAQRAHERHHRATPGRTRDAARERDHRRQERDRRLQKNRLAQTQRYQRLRRQQALRFKEYAVSP